MGKAGWIVGVAGALLALGATGAHAQVAYVSVQPQVVVVQPAPVRTWVPAHWQNVGHTRVWVQGHWVVTQPAHVVRPHPRHHHWERQARWDQDRDGIPNRHDRDIDGDGSPNWRDRAPANPRWR